MDFQLQFYKNLKNLLSEISFLISFIKRTINDINFNKKYETFERSDNDNL